MCIPCLAYGMMEFTMCIFYDDGWLVASCFSVYGRLNVVYEFTIRTDSGWIIMVGSG